MNKEIKELAIEARLGAALVLHHWGTATALTDSEQEDLKRIEKFAALVASAEREACAKVCETYETASATSGDKANAWIFKNCADRIRARGEA